MVLFLTHTQGTANSHREGGREGGQGMQLICQRWTCPMTDHELNGNPLMDNQALLLNFYWLDLGISYEYINIK